MNKNKQCYRFATASFWLMPLSVLVGATVQAEPTANKWYERSFEQLLETQIVTATRESQQRVDAPVNVSVFTAEDLQRMGLRTMEEVLERTTGFFINRQFAGAAIGSRGYISDNEQFLILVDGHSVNSIVDKGPGNLFVMPFLEQVKRIEIQRGPGSTLWGSDAALGIIHIITEDGADIDGVTATASYSNTDHQRYFNVKAGQRFDNDWSYLFSYTGAESNGYISDVEQFYLPADSNWANFEDSKEILLKVQTGGLQLSLRHMDIVNQRPGGSVKSGDIWSEAFNKTAYTTREHSYLDLKYTTHLSKYWELEGRVFADWIDRVEHKVTPSLVPGATFNERSGASDEKSWGLELLGRWDAGTGHSVLLGFRSVQTDISDVTNRVIYPATPSSNEVPVDTVRASPQGDDNNLALFAEDNWQINKHVSVTLGLRIDRNDLREDSTIVLPRFAANWKIDDAWALQYAYSTGYIRPPAGIGFLGEPQNNSDLGYVAKAYGAEDSQEVLSHDVRLSYNQKPLSVTLNLYHTTIENPFNFIFEPNSDASELLFYVNTADIKTLGSELEFNYVPSTRWNVYGNLSYVAKAELESFQGEAFGIGFDLNNSLFQFSEGAYTGDGTVVGYPHKMFNLGGNYFFTDKVSANLHYRWWSDMVSRDRNAALTIVESDKKFGPEYFVDLNIQYRAVADTGLDVSLFVKNLLDREAEITTLYYTHTWQARGRSVGAKVAYRF